MKQIRVPAFAKLNLGLEVLRLRDDGYHELRTVFQSIDLRDDLLLTLVPGTRVVCDHPEVPRDESNLGVRAALALARYAGRPPDVEVRITKRIPVAGGLGGGSSDAAAVLRGLDHLWGLGLGPVGLMPLARRLGADVPFFLVGGTALGVARGDEVYPLHRQVRGHVVVVDLQRPVSTAAVFRRIDESLTPHENGDNIFRFVSRDLGGEDGLAGLTNDLEEAALEEAPDLRRGAGRIRGILLREGARLALLSGSGSSFFGLFDERADADGARRALAAAGFVALGARTLSIDRYRERWQRALGRRTR